MTEPEKTTPPATDDKVTAGTLRKWIEDAVASRTTAKEGGSDTPSTVADQVQAALEKLKLKEKTDERDAKIDALLAGKVEQPKEKAPMERSFVHKLMGWGEPSESPREV